MRPTRRELLALSSALLWAPGLPVRAAEGDSSRKFLFVFAEGGWDQTRLFAPLFGYLGKHADLAGNRTRTN